jgi:hypothetical protein
MTDSKDGSKKRKTDYVPEPEVPEEIRARYATILEVISGAITVADGARRLGLSRNRFQTLLHRAQAGMIEELAPKPAGRPKEKSDQERSMIEEMEKLKKENERLQGRIETFERLLGVAGDLLRGRQPKRTGRNSRSKTSTSTSTTSTSSRNGRSASRTSVRRERWVFRPSWRRRWRESRRRLPPAGRVSLNGERRW